MTIPDEDAIMTDNNDSAPHEPVQGEEKPYLVALSLAQLQWFAVHARNEALYHEESCRWHMTKGHSLQAADAFDAAGAWRTFARSLARRADRALRGHEEIE